MKKLLWIGDAACPSGFARATHEILDRVKYEYDVTVLGINYRGDPHDYPYPIYAAAAGGDSFGIGRLLWMCHTVRPDVIVAQIDPWFVPYYVKTLRQKLANGEYMYPDFAGIPFVAALAVDGRNFTSEWLDGVQHAIFWTQFALDEAKAGGYVGSAEVIPLGVDLDVYYPVDKIEARGRLKIGMLKDNFIVGNINRNQPRKRWDLTLRYYAEWIKSRKVTDAFLFMHAAPTGDDTVDVKQLAKYYGIWHQLAFRDFPAFYGVTEDVMRDTYSALDVQISTTQGEGFGLTTFEGMACGTPQIVPDWSALGELCKGAVAMVPCTSTAINSVGTAVTPAPIVLGGVPDQKAFVEALDALYRDRHHREAVAHLGMERASLPQFRWQNIGDSWVEAIDRVLAGDTEQREDEATTLSAQVDA